MLLGRAIVPLTPLAYGFPEVSGWYHILDAKQHGKGQLKVCVGVCMEWKPAVVYVLVSKDHGVEFQPHSKTWQCLSTRQPASAVPYSVFR